MQGLQDVSNELMNHFSFMLNYVAGLKTNAAVPLSPYLLLVYTADQQILEAPSPTEADEWFDQSLRGNAPLYAVYVKDALYTDDQMQLSGEAFMFVLYDQNSLHRFILAQPYSGSTITGTPVWLGLLSNEFLYTQTPALPRPEPPSGKPLWKFR
ncbi:hypothetical protein [Chitinophaga qingshengii]|uniref:Uncharacterized protein n=1 Tax=Chitinophaga qingshengii TaxID=1569794 RepID=A0ABR7TSR9_9BACT|nr:hypothetical protein [Chitinophaga qingshengii]MBC9933075.1 hypothetical protein [Chitinophaga qingshengii]